MPEFSHLVRIGLITLAVFEDILVEMLAYINPIAVKVRAAAVDTFCRVIFIKAKDIDFASGATN